MYKNFSVYLDVFFLLFFKGGSSDHPGRAQEIRPALCLKVILGGIPGVMDAVELTLISSILASHLFHQRLKIISFIFGIRNLNVCT